jgi:hypothetical protein
LAETQIELAEKLKGLAELGIDAEHMVDVSTRGAAFVRQIGEVNAAQALAYDDMMAAGGPENSRAYVEYEATTRRNTELLPSESLSDEPR